MESQVAETNQMTADDGGIFGDYKTTAIVLMISTFAITADTVMNLSHRWSQLQMHSHMDTFQYAGAFAVVLLYPAIYIVGSWKLSKLNTSTPGQRKAAAWKRISKNAVLVALTCGAINLISGLR